MQANLPHAVLLADQVEPAWTFATRSRGLLGRTNLPRGTALWLKPCNSIHMFGMKFAIDAVYLDRRNHIVKVEKALQPGRISWGGWKAHSVLELAAGTVPDDPQLIGQQVTFVD